MNNKHYIPYLIGLFILVDIILLWLLFFNSSDETEKEQSNQTDSHITSSDNFELTANFLGDNKWEYSIIGTLPNPCYQVESSVLVAESYPEQVQIQVDITPPLDDEICIQVIQDVFLDGTFQASSEARIQLTVKSN